MEKPCMDTGMQDTVMHVSVNSDVDTAVNVCNYLCHLNSCTTVVTASLSLT